VEPVDGLGSDPECGVETETAICADEIIIDRLGNGHDGHPLLRKAKRVLVGSSTAEAHERIQFVESEVLKHDIGHVHDRTPHLHAMWLVTTGSQDRSATGQDAAQHVAVEPDDAVLHQTTKSILEADDIPAVLTDRGLSDGADRRIQTGRIAPGGEYPDALRH
jgi:hypothetical protein